MWLTVASAIGKRLVGLLASPWSWVVILAATTVLCARMYDSQRDTTAEVRAELAAELECGEGSACAARTIEARERAFSATQEKLDEYEQELADLRNRPVSRRIIRVCPDPSDVSLSGGAGTIDGSPASPSIVHGSVEFDTEPLYHLAREADELAARLRALQGWNRALTASPSSP